MPWIDLLICYLFGCFGIHKFREKKIGLGVLYLFTFGLFGIGWLVDCIKYLIVAIKSTLNKKSQVIQTESTPNTNNPTSKDVQPVYNFNKPTTDNSESMFINDDVIKPVNSNNTTKNIIRWICTGILVVFALVCLPSFSSIIAIMCAVIIAPVAKLQSVINKYIKRNVKIAIAISLAVIALFSIPSNNSKSDNNSILAIADTTNSPTESVIVTTTDTPTEVATETETEAPTKATTKATEVPTVASSETTHKHTYSAATCTAPKTCSCGATEGSAIGHDYKKATCTSPKTCVSCGVTTGSTIGHTYSNGSCTSCGSSDPNYVSETLVWIPTNGGQKYHTNSGCSNMIDPIQVTKTEAINQGFTPCGRCY